MWRRTRRCIGWSRAWAPGAGGAVGRRGSGARALVGGPRPQRAAGCRCGLDSGGGALGEQGGRRCPFQGRLRVLSDGVLCVGRGASVGEAAGGQRGRERHRGLPRGHRRRGVGAAGGGRGGPPRRRRQEPGGSPAGCAGSTPPAARLCSRRGCGTATSGSWPQPAPQTRSEPPWRKAWQTPAFGNRPRPAPNAAPAGGPKPPTRPASSMCRAGRRGPGWWRAASGCTPERSAACSPARTSAATGSTPTKKARPPGSTKHMRSHADIEDAIARLKDSGLARMPFTDLHANCTWAALCMAGLMLVGWFQTHCLTGQLAKAAPKRLRRQLWHLPALVCRTARQTILRLPQQHPGARALLATAPPTPPPTPQPPQTTNRSPEHAKNTPNNTHMNNQG